MLTIPVYHLMVYNGVLTMGNQGNVVAGLFLSSGGAITADYAFMALTAYFLLETKNRPIWRRFFAFFAQVLTIYSVRAIVIRSLWGFHSGNWFVEDFILGGAWWFVLPYMLLLLTYPYLNRAMEQMSAPVHAVLCLVLGVWFFYNGLTLRLNTVNDIVAFLFTYTTMGYLRRGDYARWVLPTRKPHMALLYLIGFAATFGVCCYGITSGAMTEEVGTALEQYLIGRYSPQQFVMGLAVFFFFRDLQMPTSHRVNELAKSTFFVFLLHETVMGVFWYFGKIDGQYSFYEPWAFWAWMLLYDAICLAVGVIAQKIYERWIAPCWDELIHRVCTRFSFFQR